MESLFDKDPTQGPPLSNYDRIEKEIAHLKKGTSVRTAPGQQGRKIGSWVLISVILAIIGFYVMDPFIYALKKSDAIDIYLYLHNCDGKTSTDALLATQIFSDDEIRALNKRQGSFQDYFSSPQEAEAKAAAIVHFIDGLHNLHANRYDQLSTIDKIRCVLFVRNGLLPPMSWNMLNPTVEYEAPAPAAPPTDAPQQN